LKIAPIDDALRRRYSLDEQIDGVVIIDVDPDGPAAEKGISAGDRIIQVSQEDVTNTNDVSRLIQDAKNKKQKSVLLRIENRAGLRFVAIRLRTP